MKSQQRKQSFPFYFFWVFSLWISCGPSAPGIQRQAREASDFVAATFAIPGSLSLTRSLQVGERKARSPSQSKETERPIWASNSDTPKARNREGGSHSLWIMRPLIVERNRSTKRETGIICESSPTCLFIRMFLSGYSWLLPHGTEFSGGCFWPFDDGDSGEISIFVYFVHSFGNNVEFSALRF